MTSKVRQPLRKGMQVLQHLCVTILAFAILGIYVLIALNLKVFSPVAKAIGDYSFEDFYYDVLAYDRHQDTSRVVTIVDMTELINRRDLSHIISDINELSPKVLGVDIVFEGLKDDSIGDRLLATTVQPLKSAVFAYKLTGKNEAEIVHSYFMANDSMPEGFVNMPRLLYGGVKRTLSIGRNIQDQTMPSFIKMVADSYAGEETVPLSDEELPINFTPTHFRVIRFDSIQAYRELIEDHVVLLGAVNDDLDLHYTPLGKMCGVELLAYGIETLISQKTVWEAPKWVTWLLSFVMVLLIVIIRTAYLRFCERRSPLLRELMQSRLVVGLFVFLLTAILVWVAFIAFYLYHLKINLTYALLAIALIFPAANLYDVIKDMLKIK